MEERERWEQGKGKVRYMGMGVYEVLEVFPCGLGSGEETRWLL